MLVLLALGVWLLAKGGEPVVTQTRPVAAFSAVELTGSNVIAVRVGAPRSVAVHAHKSMLNRITTVVVGGTLVVGDVPGRGETKGPISVSVSVPSLDSLRIAARGSGVVGVTGIDSSNFAVTVDGSGAVRASGNVTRLGVSIGGSGDVELGGLVARDAHALVSGSGRIVVTATDSLNASMRGTGVIQYERNPARLTTSVTGSGVIMPGWRAPDSSSRNPSQAGHFKAPTTPVVA